MPKETHEWRPRMYVDISEEQAAKLALIMYHGSRKIVFPALCDMMINFVQKHGHYGIGAISSGNTEIVFKMEEKKDVVAETNTGSTTDTNQSSSGSV
jgi:hypothetical protein